MKKPSSLGHRLRELRRKRALPQIEVATAVGISRSHLAEIEGGKDPGFRTFCDLADFFGVSLDFLSRGDAPHRQDIGETVVEADELTLIRFWRGLSAEEKRLLLSLLVRDGGAVVA
ncbi:helix-turn-helix domain-containing protein [Novacetimonas hansenii]|uniref:Helix-turn-helix transcriptional regulator n=1 Tax=Novacetimonas hansenii TaxID=436 RepID=A0AAW5EPE1_NOVHA|nr:helix-turn-helix transcriptional regulator [Novacetimonas hansenii]MCJ8352723.1 helix-turn-helix transcriptional regulator [Novacetimonas hansenii]